MYIITYYETQVYIGREETDLHLGTEVIRWVVLYKAQVAWRGMPYLIYNINSIECSHFYENALRRP